MTANSFSQLKLTRDENRKLMMSNPEPDRTIRYGLLAISALPF